MSDHVNVTVQEQKEWTKISGRDASATAARLSFIAKRLLPLSLKDAAAKIDAVTKATGVSVSGMSGGAVSRNQTIAKVYVQDGGLSPQEIVAALQEYGRADDMDRLYYVMRDAVKRGDVRDPKKDALSRDEVRTLLERVAKDERSTSELKGNGGGKKRPSEPKQDPAITDAVRRALSRGVAVDAIVAAIDAL